MAEKQLNLYQRMIAAMGEVRYIQKTRGKDGELKFTIVTHDAVTALCREALMKHGVYAYPEVTGREFATFTHTKFYQGQEQVTEYAAMTVQLVMHFVNADAPDERISVPSIGIGVDKLIQQDKCPGKAISYAVKYGYLKALALETGDDPDTEQQRGDEKASRNAQDAPQATIVPNMMPPAPQPRIGVTEDGTVTTAPKMVPDLQAPASPAKAALQPVWNPKDEINRYLENLAALYDHDIKQVRKIARQYIKIERPGIDLDTLDKAGVDDMTALLSKCFKEQNSQEPKGN